MATQTKGVKDLLTKGVFGVGASVIAKFFVEFFRIPVLSEKGSFGNDFSAGGLDNYTVAVYAITAGGSSAGIIDYFSNSKPLGFSKEFLPYFIGFGIGTGLYDHFLSNLLGLNKYNPYNMIYDAIPSVPLL